MPKTKNLGTFPQNAVFWYPLTNCPNIVNQPIFNQKRHRCQFMTRLLFWGQKIRFRRVDAKCWYLCVDKAVEQNELEMCLHEKANQMSHKLGKSLTKKMSGSSRNLKYILPAILSGCYQKCLSRGEECCQKFPLSVDHRCPILRAGFFPQTRDLVLLSLFHFHFTFRRCLICRQY